MPELQMTPPAGRWLPILRETRMPAVVCQLGPPAIIVEQTAELATALHRALEAWATTPIEV